MKRSFQLLIWLVIWTGRLNAQQATDTAFNQMKVYELGEVVVSAKILVKSVPQSDMQKFNNPDVGTAINILPSVVLTKSGARNESTIYLRGFDIRSVPVYADGIPVYVPFDGYVDLARFTNAGLSKIEISKGYSSILYGANTLGGSINLISSKPDRKIGIGLKAGILSGKGYTTSASIGSQAGKFYLQGNFSTFNRAYFVLSKDFRTTENETDLKRDNAYRDDTKVSLKVGFLPNSTDEYSLNYIYQRGEKGNPIYLGQDESVRIRYWQWPHWDKQSVYFISKTTLSHKNYLKTRLFYDGFVNQLNSYDDKDYTEQTRPYAFTSYYNDYSYGGNLEAGTEFIKNNVLKIAAHYKYDMHRENNEGEPVRHFADQTFSFGIEDVFSPSGKLKFIPGISYNLRNSLVAEDYDAETGIISEFPENRNDAVNAQMAAYCKISDALGLSLTVAHKTRFATIKDRYSYRLGTAIPNPDLKAETAMNYEIASDVYFNGKITLEPAFFYSRLQNTIQLVDNIQPGISQQQNTGEAEFYGAELTFNFLIRPNIKFNANYTYIEQKNITHPEILFTDVPRHNLFAYVDYFPVKNIEFIFSVEYNSDRYSTSYGNVSPEFVIFNTQVSGILARYFKVEVGVNNIFDKNYTLSEGYPEEGRNYYLSLLFNLKK
jgi:iron complex outermembrane receptor protein